MDHSNSPIFVVGVPRSGTTLLAAMLAAHSRLSCGSEQHMFVYLSRLPLSKKIELYDLSNWPNHAVEFLFSCMYFEQSVPEHYGISRSDLESHLRGKPPEIKSIVAAIPEIKMLRDGKVRWVDKTPNHLQYLAEIRACFPEASIVQIVRDPRDTALSIMKTPWSWAPHRWENALLFWHEYNAHGMEFFAVDPNSYTARYDDLVQDTEETLKNLCLFLGEEFETSMLDTSRSSQDVLTVSDSSWHQRVASVPDRDRIGVWRREISPHENIVAEALLNVAMRQYGFPVENQFNKKAAVYPSLYLLDSYPKLIIDLSMDGYEFTGDLTDANLLLFIGHPVHENWFGKSRLERYKNVIRLLALVTMAKLRGTSIVWNNDAPEKSDLGKAGFLVTAYMTIIGRMNAVPKKRGILPE